MTHTNRYPTWKNTYADVISFSYPRIIQDFHQDVVATAIGKLQEDANKYRKGDDPAAPFYVCDIEDLIAESLKAFCLSLNSLWERQLRSLMAGVAQELFGDEKLVKQCQTWSWTKLDGLFEQLRGYKLSAFRAYDDLDTLHVNAGIKLHHLAGVKIHHSFVMEGCP